MSSRKLRAGSTISVDGAVDGEDVRRRALYIPYDEAFPWCSLEYRILSRVKGARCFICLEKIQIGIAISLRFEEGEERKGEGRDEKRRDRRLAEYAIFTVSDGFLLRQSTDTLLVNVELLF